MIRKPRLDLHLRQELIPLPLIIQEATLLEMDLLELREAVLTEMSSNPLIDIDKYSDFKILAAKYEDLSKLAEIMEENVEWHGEEEEDDLKVRRDELIPAQEPSIWEKLEIQIESYFDSEEDKKIAYAILEHLDSFGYLDKKFRLNPILIVKRIRRLPMQSWNISIVSGILIKNRKIWQKSWGWILRI